MHQSAAEGAGGLPNRICKKKYDARRRFPFSILCASVVCRSEMSPSFTFCHVDMLCHLPKTRHNSHIGRCSLFLQDVVQLLHAPCPFSTRTSLFTNAFGVSGIVWNLCWRDAVVWDLLVVLYRGSVYACIFPQEISRSTTFKLFRL